MYQPHGFVDPQFPNHVCRLRGLLYGLKQALYVWFQCFSTHIWRTWAFVCLQRTPLFTYFCGTTRLYLLIYVDDILVIGNSPAHIITLIKDLGQRFSMKDLYS